MWVTLVWKFNLYSSCNFFHQAEDKVRIQQEKLELAQQNLNQSLRKAEALPKIEEELAVQMAALNEVQKSIHNRKENLFLP